jgi:hypothetical protein
MRSKLILLSIGLGMNVLLDNAVAATQPSIGVVISVQGQALVSNQENQQKVLQRGATIYLHDKVATQKDSKAQLRLQDDSVIIVQPLSEFSVSEFSFNKNAPRNNKYVGNIIKGALINISGQGDAKNYQLNSPLTTIAFRGTGLATKLVTKGKAVANQDVYVFQGYVQVTNKCGNVVGPCETRSINIGAGQQVNAATIDALGRIQGHQSSGLLESGSGGVDGKVVTQGGGGGVSITCKGKR